jgi:hypothetical protein
MKGEDLRKLVKEEIKDFFKTRKYSLEDELILENEIILGELLDPGNHYEYWGSKGWYNYKDVNNVTFFVRLTYQPLSTPYFELKTGWLDEEDNPQYEPSVPPVSPNSSAIDLDKRSNTLAKIYRDEVLPFFKTQTLSEKMVIKPISPSRSRFSRMLISKFTSTVDFDVDLENLEIYKRSKK